MSEVKNKLNEIMQSHVKNGEFKSQAAKDRRAYHNLAQLENQIEKLENDFNEGKISNEDFEAGLKGASEKLDQLLDEYENADHPDYEAMIKDIRKE
jgi:tyrosyl-tRNA synthetase